VPVSVIAPDEPTASTTFPRIDSYQAASPIL
jgi:hypothetical protein